MSAKSIMVRVFLNKVQVYTINNDSRYPIVPMYRPPAASIR